MATATIEAVDLATDELRDALGPLGGEVGLLAPGILEVRVADAAAAAARVVEAEPVFIRHLAPARCEGRLLPEASVAQTLEAIVAEALRAPATARLGVQIRSVEGAQLSRRDCWAALEPRLGAARNLDARHPEWVLSALITGDTVRYGVSPVALNLSPWAGGARHFARQGDEVSRAEFKLEEAIEAFGIPVSAGTRAWDLGAAPGGWTRRLHARGASVVAVDPAALAAAVAALPRVTHARARAEDFLRGLDPGHGGSVDLIVNDMRMDARDAARLLGRCAPHLAPGGIVLTTLKLPRTRPRAIIAEALAILGQTFSVGPVRQLFHNRSEVTVLLRGR